MKIENKEYVSISSRAGAIVCHDNSLLLMYRQKSSHIYHVFPGGTVELGETLQIAAVRELAEETSVIAEPVRLLYHLRILDIPLKNNLDPEKSYCKDEYYFLCNYVSGTPAMSDNAIEQQRINVDNTYKPLYVPFDLLSDMVIYPLEIKDLFLADFKNGFSSDVKTIHVSHSNLRRI